MEKILIEVADFKVANSGTILETLSLGSCVGIVLYDQVSKVGGMAHIMLPDSTLSKIQASPMKFADTSLRLMLSKMLELGADKNRVIAKIAGGASMFESATEEKVMNIGDRNVEAVKKVLKELNIRLLAEDTGENYGRTIEFNLATGRMLVKAAQRETKEY
ncbi:MAG: chemotaxis protein CheD [Elusimicrobia bacterium]|nr:chemotaxis protein CheD [Candidatus Liberimonas magnetica]